MRKKSTVKIFRIEAFCPDIRAQVDQEQVSEVLHASPGFSSFECNLPLHRLTVFTANQDGGKDILFRLSHAGFPAQDFEVFELPTNRNERQST